jgi:prephenate dehydrogenase
MVIAVVGIGIVGKTLVEHFKHLGHEVLQVERDSELTPPEAAKKANVVFVVTQPMSEVWKLLQIASTNMLPGSLLVHGTSVEAPHGHDERGRVLAEGVTLAHLHFHFRPQAPLRETLKIEGDGAKAWQYWLEDQFQPYQPFIHHLSGPRHDETTTISQLLHMATAFGVGSVWQKAQSEDLELGLTIMGPPGRFVARSVIRTAGGARVAADILAEHPKALDIIHQLVQAYSDLGTLIEQGRTDVIESVIARNRDLVPLEILDVLETRTNQLIRLEADLQRSNVVLHFAAEANVVGLLARALGEFDRRGIDKTTTIAQTNPDGSCTFVIGVREWTSAVDEAIESVRSWS